MKKAEMGLAGPEDIRREMERFFEHLERWKRPVFFFEKAWKPDCDVSETADEVIIIADLGGVNEEDLGVKVEGGELVLQGIRREPASSPRRNYLQMEINYGPFERAIRLPVPVDAHNATADFEDGFLEVRLPKIKRGPRREVDIDVSE